jgi:hypothetical protein
MNPKWPAIPILMLMAVPVVWAARSAYWSDAMAPEAQVEGIAGRVEPEALQAWVLQTHNPPVQTYARARRSRWSLRSAWSPRPGHSLANRNRNPLNIKLGQLTRHYIERGDATLSAVSPLDGGRFLKFDAPETGFRAALDLLRSRHYEDLNLAGVFRRWSNNGFGPEILAGTRLGARTPVRNLGASEFAQLLGAMAAAEGYRSPTVVAEIARAIEMTAPRR